MFCYRSTSVHSKGTYGLGVTAGAERGIRCISSEGRTQGSCRRPDLGIGISRRALTMDDHSLVYCVRRAGETGQRDRNEALALWRGVWRKRDSSFRCRMILARRQIYKRRNVTPHSWKRHKGLRHRVLHPRFDFGNGRLIESLCHPRSSLKRVAQPAQVSRPAHDIRNVPSVPQFVPQFLSPSFVCPPVSQFPEFLRLSPSFCPEFLSEFASVPEFPGGWSLALTSTPPASRGVGRGSHPVLCAYRCVYSAWPRKWER